MELLKKRNHAHVAATDLINDSTPNGELVSYKITKPNLHFVVDNKFSELKTDKDKLIARRNLGIEYGLGESLYYRGEFNAGLIDKPGIYDKIVLGRPNGDLDEYYTLILCLDSTTQFIISLKYDGRIFSRKDKNGQWVQLLSLYSGTFNADWRNNLSC